MFDKCIDRIIYHCDELLYDNKLNNGQCKYLFMVGGLSQSKYFQQKIIEAYGQDMDIIIPSCSVLSIVSGAARFGIERKFIQSRKLTKSYAIRITATPERAKSTFKLSDKYIKKHTVNPYGAVRVWGVLDYFVNENDEINLNFKFRKTYYRVNKKQKTVDFHIYSHQTTENDKTRPNTIFNSDVLPLGKFSLPFSDDINERETVVEYTFDDTILRIYAYPKNRPKQKRSLPIIHQDPFRNIVQ